MQHTFILTPQDVLFLRDARPMEAADAGLGANWPRPDQLYAALHHDFLRRWPEPQTWEGNGKHTYREKGENIGSKDINKHSSFRFGALKAVGPFPVKNGKAFFPCPLDLAMKLIPMPEGQTDLPSPLTHAFSSVHEGKTQLPAWISEDDYTRYLSAIPESYYAGDNKLVPPLKEELFAADRNIGIGIDPATGTTVEGKFYQAEYLRLAQDVVMAFKAECLVKPRGGNGQEHDLFEQDWTGGDIIMGGQQGVLHVEGATQEFVFPSVSAGMSSRYLRWTLLTPAVFKDGWLPGWCKDSRKDIAENQKAKLGTVMLKDCGFARLVAARVGKPEAFSGWELDLPERGLDRKSRSGGPKPTQLAVPAGSCYVFDCGSAENASLLAAKLHLRSRSDLLGEKGFGIGVCSSVQI